MTDLANTEVRVIDDMPNAVYHAHPAIGSSMLRDFIESPRLFEGRYIHSPPSVPREPTDAMDFGTVLHTAILADQPLEEVVVRIPADVLSKSGSRAGGKWEDFQFEHQGKILLKEEELGRVLIARKAVLDHPIAGKIIRSEGPVEQSIFWHDEETGLECKARLDKPTLAFGDRWIADLKSSADPRPVPWTKSAESFGYHIQKALYQRAFEVAHGERPPFVFIVVSSKPPFMCWVHDLDEQATAAGDLACTEALRDIAQRKASGDWSEPNEFSINQLSYSRWFYQRS